MLNTTSDKNPILLHQKAQIERLQMLGENFSAVYSFPTMYLWQKAFKFSLLLTDELYSIRCYAKGDNVWFFPCGDESACRRFVEEHMSEKDFQLIGINEKAMRNMEEWFPGCFEFTDERDSYEYILDVHEHVELKGSAYRHVRNHWNKASREHELHLEALTDEGMDTVWQILEEWKTNHDAAAGDVLSDEAEKLLFSSRKELNAELYILYVDGERFGIIGGYPITENIFDLSIAKERYHIPGVSYAAKRLLFEKLDGRYKYANLEDDLGLDGLRQMKKSLSPVMMNRMWSARLIRQED